MSYQIRRFRLPLEKVSLGLWLLIIGIPGDIDFKPVQAAITDTQAVQPAPVMAREFHLSLDNLPNRVAFSSGALANDVMDSLKEKYAAHRPQKVHAALVLGIDGGHRQRSAVKSIQSFVTQQEYALARRWVKEEAQRFDALLERRIAIMNLSNRELIPELLEYNDIAAQLLTQQIHEEIIDRIQVRQLELRRAQIEASRNRDR